MQPGMWRVLALLLIAGGFAFVIYDSLAPQPPDYGLHVGLAPAANGITVTKVDPNSPGSRAGIHAGDVVSYGRTAFERAKVRYAPPGTRVTVRVNGSRDVTLRAPPVEILLLPVALVIRIAFLAVAALLAWRRPQDPSARALVTFLLCYGMLIGLQNGLMPSPELSALVLGIGSPFFFLAGTAAATVFVSVFPSGAAMPLPRLFARLASVLAVAGIIISIGAFWIQAPGVEQKLAIAVQLLLVMQAALFLATLILAYVQGAAAERPRRRWVFLLLGAGLFTGFIDVTLSSTIGYSDVVDNIALLCIGAIPFGLAYVILRHRVIDVGFVINRAVVYASVSFVIVGIFVIVETLVSKYVERSSHAGSIALELAVALALGFSVRAIHARVDRFVDTVFFRERHAAEQAMHEFAFDAAYITDRATLLERCVATVQRCVRASAAGIWLRDQNTYIEEHGAFPAAAVDENDPAILAMRARHTIADLYALQSSLPGALAFPMIVRGELIGVLVCGGKNDEETYAPDERDALAAIAAAVGHALDALRIADLQRTVRSLLEREAHGATQGALDTL